VRVGSVVLCYSSVLLCGYHGLFCIGLNEFGNVWFGIDSTMGYKVMAVYVSGFGYGSAANFDLQVLDGSN
jgi:hypothetical protein